ncbi:MAG: hypothetical protein HY757_04625 [Nitrospirae bacterium]|nr:hypothetical protein [Nitrospirota bacterium]
MKYEYGQCSICKDRYTLQHVEIAPETIIYVCSDCIEKAKDNFIWVCMTCGKSYIRPKKLVINRVKDLELKKAYMLCEDMLVIQGIDMCIACSPELILDYAEMHESVMEC